MRRRHLLPASLLACAAAHGAQIDIRVTDARGRPVADAVIELAADGATAPPPPASAQTRIVDQRAEQFIPYVEVFRPGDSVVFTNSDDTRHHVYSFSAAKRFEFVLAPGERSPPQRLERAGDIAVGCNIHDFMVTYLHVTAAPWVARTDARGEARIDGLPAATVQVSAWHPQLRPGKEPRSVRVVPGSAPASEAVRFVLDLMPDPRGERDPERSDY
jgi:plastocyanin